MKIVDLSEDTELLVVDQEAGKRTRRASNMAPSVRVLYCTS